MSAISPKSCKTWNGASPTPRCCWVSAFLDPTHQMPQRHFQPVTAKLVPSICTRPPGGRSIPSENCGGRSAKGAPGKGRVAPLVDQSRSLPDWSTQNFRRKRKWGVLGDPPVVLCHHQALPPGSRGHPNPRLYLGLPLAPCMQNLWHWPGAATEPFAGLRHLRASGVQSFAS